MANSLYSGGLPKEYRNYKNGNYRVIGEDAGYLAGNLTQAALARAAVKKCGDLLDKKRGETLSPPVNEGGVELLVVLGKHIYPILMKYHQRSNQE